MDKLGQIGGFSSQYNTSLYHGGKILPGLGLHSNACKRSLTLRW